MKNNPFKILDITPSADKKMIMRQVTLAMKKREYNPKTIVESQKTLFNPITKAVEEFQYFLTINTMSQASGQLTKAANMKAKDGYEQHIPQLLNLDNEKTTA